MNFVRGGSKALKQSTRMGSSFNVPKGSRPISTVTEPTTKNEKGQVIGPGHTAFVTSESERKRYPFLSKTYGHKPDKHAKSFDPTTVVSKFPMSDVKEFRDQPFKIKAFTKPALPLSQDPTVFGSKAQSVDHGEMTEEEAHALHNFKFKDIYEVSGAKRANCVHGWHAMAKDVLGFDLPDYEDHLTPQGSHEFAKTQFLDPRRNSSNKF